MLRSERVAQFDTCAAARTFVCCGRVRVRIKHDRERIERGAPNAEAGGSSPPRANPGMRELTLSKEARIPAEPIS